MRLLFLAIAAVLLAAGPVPSDVRAPSGTVVPSEDAALMSVRMGVVQTTKVVDRFKKTEIRKFTRTIGFATTAKNAPVVALCLWGRGTNGSGSAWLEVQVIDGNKDADPPVQWDSVELVLLCDDDSETARTAPWDAEFEGYNDSVSIYKAPGIPSIAVSNYGAASHRSGNIVKCGFELTGQGELANTISRAKKTECRLTLRRDGEELVREFQLSSQHVSAIKDFCRQVDPERQSRPQPSPPIR